MTDDEQIRALMGIISEHAAILRGLNAQMAPVNARASAIAREIKLTHKVVRDHEAPRQWEPRRDHDGLQVRGYGGAPEQRERRFGLFAELDRLSEVHGPTREKVRFHSAEMHGAKRAVERIIERRKKAR
jgi:hypothetical protein